MNDTFFLELLVCELVGAENLVFLLFARFAFGLGAHVVEVGFVGFELADQVEVVVADSAEGERCFWEYDNMYGIWDMG